jgi:hypothetical protein
MGTVKEWLEDVAKTNKSSEVDSKKMQSLLHKVGFDNAVVVYGVVYPEGKGRPVSIHSMAKEILSSISDDSKKKGTWAKRRDDNEGWHSFDEAEKHGYIVLMEQPHSYRVTQKGKKRLKMDEANAKRRVGRHEKGRIKSLSKASRVK